MRTLGEILVAVDDAYAVHPQGGGPADGGRPVAVGLPESVDEVCALVDHARTEGLRVAVHTTGRGVRQTGPLEDTLLIRTSGLTGATLDAPAAVVRAAGGCMWSDVSRVAAPAGLAALAVTTASIGVAGSVLAGGVGWLSRRHGLSAESVRAVELVTADGRVARADADHERDLFWALRGGGGGLGVVIAVELAVIAPGELHAGTLAWPGQRPPASCTPGATGPRAPRARRRASPASPKARSGSRRSSSAAATSPAPCSPRCGRSAAARHVRAGNPVGARHAARGRPARPARPLRPPAARRAAAGGGRRAAGGGGPPVRASRCSTWSCASSEAP